MKTLSSVISLVKWLGIWRENKGTRHKERVELLEVRDCREMARVNAIKSSVCSSETVEMQILFCPQSHVCRRLEHSVLTKWLGNVARNPPFGYSLSRVCTSPNVHHRLPTGVSRTTFLSPVYRKAKITAFHPDGYTSLSQHYHVRSTKVTLCTITSLFLLIVIGSSKPSHTSEITTPFPAWKQLRKLSSPPSPQGILAKVEVSTLTLNFGYQRSGSWHSRDPTKGNATHQRKKMRLTTWSQRTLYKTRKAARLRLSWG